MPISIAQLTADRRTVTIDFGGETLTVVYKPSAVNAVQEARELEEREKGRYLAAQARSLSEMIVSWDVVDADGNPLDPTPELIATFGLDTTSKIQRALMDDLLPNRPTSEPSSNGSSPTGRSARARNGTAS